MDLIIASILSLAFVVVLFKNERETTHGEIGETKAENPGPHNGYTLSFERRFHDGKWRKFLLFDNGEIRQGWALTDDLPYGTRSNN